MKPVAEPDRLEGFGTVLVLVLVLIQKLVQVEVQVQVQIDTVMVLVRKQVQVEVRPKPVFLDIDQVKQHTAVPNVEANSGKWEHVEAQQQKA